MDDLGFIPCDINNVLWTWDGEFWIFYWWYYDTYFFLNIFQEFDDHRDADDAVYELNGKDLLGER